MSLARVVMRLIERDWRKFLSPRQFKILREKGTESPGMGKLLHNKRKGIYVCSGCGNKLFKSDHKFDSGTGWPSFFDVAKNENIKVKRDWSMGIPRMEVLCAKCGGHLGHVFSDGPREKTGKRYCINSVALDFKEIKKKK